MSGKVTCPQAVSRESHRTRNKNKQTNTSLFTNRVRGGWRLGGSMWSDAGLGTRSGTWLDTHASLTPVNAHHSIVEVDLGRVDSANVGNLLKEEIGNLPAQRERLGVRTPSRWM
jgi:hypothetical protein